MKGEEAKLGYIPTRSLVERATNEKLAQWLEEHPTEARQIGSLCIFGWDGLYWVRFSGAGVGYTHPNAPTTPKFVYRDQGWGGRRGWGGAGVRDSGPQP